MLDEAVPEAVKDAHIRVWERHWPHTVPDGWNATEWFKLPGRGEQFLHGIDRVSWQLENACHFLGQPYLIMYKENEELFLVKVSGLFLIFNPDAANCGAYGVISPDITLDEIIARLSGEDGTEFFALEDITVNVAIPDGSVLNEPL